MWVVSSNFKWNFIYCTPVITHKKLNLFSENQKSHVEIKMLTLIPNDIEKHSNGQMLQIASWVQYPNTFYCWSLKQAISQWHSSIMKTRTRCHFSWLYCEKSNRLLRSIYIDTMLMASSSVQLQMWFSNNVVGNLQLLSLWNKVTQKSLFYEILLIITCAMIKRCTKETTP